jgi:hypothetical protein
VPLTLLDSAIELGVETIITLKSQTVDSRTVLVIEWFITKKQQ